MITDNGHFVVIGDILFVKENVMIPMVQGIIENAHRIGTVDTFYQKVIWVHLLANLRSSKS